MEPQTQPLRYRPFVLIYKGDILNMKLKEILLLATIYLMYRTVKKNKLNKK